MENYLADRAYDFTVLDDGKAGHDLSLSSYHLYPAYLGDARFNNLQYSEVGEKIGKGFSLGPARRQAEEFLGRLVHERHVALLIDDNHAFVPVP